MGKFPVSDLMWYLAGLRVPKVVVVSGLVFGHCQQRVLRWIDYRHRRPDGRLRKPKPEEIG